MPYASLDDFDDIIHHLVTDTAPQNVALSSAELLATLSLLLRTYQLPDIPHEAATVLVELCRTYANELIARYPYCEGYMDFLFGAAMIHRAGFEK